MESIYQESTPTGKNEESDIMRVLKLCLPVMIATLLIIAFLPPVSAESQFLGMNTAYGAGVFTGRTGTSPAFFPPVTIPSPFIPGDSSGIRATFNSPRSIEHLLSVNYVPGDYLAQLPPLVLESSVSSSPRYSWDEMFTNPSCGCGGCG